MHKTVCAFLSLPLWAMGATPPPGRTTTFKSVYLAVVLSVLDEFAQPEKRIVPLP